VPAIFRVSANEAPLECAVQQTTRHAETAQQEPVLMGRDLQAPSRRAALEGRPANGAAIRAGEKRRGGSRRSRMEEESLPGPAAIEGPAASLLDSLVVDEHNPLHRESIAAAAMPARSAPNIIGRCVGEPGTRCGSELNGRRRRPAARRSRGVDRIGEEAGGVMIFGAAQVHLCATRPTNFRSRRLPGNAAETPPDLDVKFHLCGRMRSHADSSDYLAWSSDGLHRRGPHLPAIYRSALDPSGRELIDDAPRRAAFVLIACEGRFNRGAAEAYGARAEARSVSGELHARACALCAIDQVFEMGLRNSWAACAAIIATAVRGIGRQFLGIERSHACAFPSTTPRASIFDQPPAFDHRCAAPAKASGRPSARLWRIGRAGKRPNGSTSRNSHASRGAAARPCRDSGARPHEYRGSETVAAYARCGAARAVLAAQLGLTRHDASFDP